MLTFTVEPIKFQNAFFKLYVNMLKLNKKTTVRKQSIYPCSKLWNNPSISYASKFVYLNFTFQFLKVFITETSYYIRGRLCVVAATKCDADGTQDVQSVRHTLQTWQSVIISLWRICESEAAIKMLCW